ncbi:protocadherin alpha-7-like isoform X3 [Corythoichthys intestinalis]|uniref:protocadherin alpha-7-like isoform X3 n=1 Tax=Corythoichthys intestinalis TaxID=161448 RepID=UPI0025A4F04B|nr:protocadherin alpha-7-like isoform X3 [Corythoichthys intestinalis]
MVCLLRLCVTVRLLARAFLFKPYISSLLHSSCWISLQFIQLCSSAWTSIWTHNRSTMPRRGRALWAQRLLVVIFCLNRTLDFTLAQLRYSISEEGKDDALVGNVAKDLGLDVSGLDARGFRVVSGPAEPLFVLTNNGMLRLKSKIDREEICERISTCVVNIKIVVENPLEVHYVAVEILDVNDHSPAFPDNKTRLEISESALPGARFQLQSAHDPDSDTYSVHSYKISSNEHFRLEVKDRGVDGKIPVLYLHKALDKESARSHKLLLTAVDGGKPARSGSTEILIHVLDVNDNMPFFTSESYSAVLKENAPVGTTILQVNATDLDDGLNGEVVYSFGNNVNSKLRKVFDVDAITGEIIVKGPIDFEIKDKYEIDIKASDRGPVPLETEKSIIITILDLNDNMPEIELTSFSNAIAEDSKPGTTVALISVNDKDSGVNGKVICHVKDDIPFMLTPSLQDNMFSLITKSHLDREHQSKYDVTIVAKDAGEPPLSSQKTISVTVSDVNDNRPKFSSTLYTFYINENNIAGAFLFSVSAYDNDEGDNALISYDIVRNGDEHKFMTSFLSINSENGQISALKSFDFETMKSFHFQVTATDGGNTPLSSNVTVNVYILDQNDNAPVILYPMSSNGSAEGVEEIPRNMKPGDLVTKVRAYDADIGYNGWLLFSLWQVTDHSLFSLDRYTGQIRTLRSLTETDEAEHRLLILVKDNGNVSLSATATVTVKLVEPKEAFAASDIKSAAKVDQEDDNMTFYLIITLGSVSLLFVISIIVLIAMQCSKSTEYTSKYLQDTNYDGTLCHSIQYRSGDKRYMLVGPRMSIGSTVVPGSHANTLVLPDRRHTSGEPKAPNSDWRYSASLRAGGVMQSSVHMEESSVMQGAQGVLVQNWPTASSAADAEGGEVSPPMGAGVDSNSWHFRYGPGGPGAPPQHLKAGEVPPEAFIIPGSPAIISIRQNQGGEDDKSDFITFGKKEEAKKKKKKKKDKKDKKDKGKDDDE